MRYLTYSGLALILVCLVGAPVPGHTQPPYDFAAEREELSVPGETVQQSDAAVTEALRQSRMQVTVSTVGFDIERDQVAQQTLQNMAQAGGGGYFTAADTDQLATALGAAATGQVPTTASGDYGDLTICRDIVDGNPQGAATHFAQIGKVVAFLRFRDLPQNTLSQVSWKHNGQEFSQGERAIGGNGWVWFSVSTTRPGGFEAGTYEVTIQAPGRLLGRRTFTIGASTTVGASGTTSAPAAAPTPPPVAAAPPPPPPPPPPVVAFALTHPQDGQKVEKTALVRGTAPPGRTVRVTVKYYFKILVEGYADLRKEDVRADQNGAWRTSELDFAIPLVGMARDYQIIAELLDDQGHPADTTKITVKGK